MSDPQRYWLIVGVSTALALLATVSCVSQRSPTEQRVFRVADLPEARDNPPPPKPEPVALTPLPLPPTAPSGAAGVCTVAINPHGTGCMSGSDSGMLEGPAYMWDGRHVLVSVVFTGAPPAPDPASIYSGTQVIAVKTDGTLFPNGDAWKCLTCGVPAENAQGVAVPVTSASGDVRIALDHPQAFWGDQRIIAGTNIVDCGSYALTDAACTADRIHIYPIRWNSSADGSGYGTPMRELRLNPDSVHLGWNSFVGHGEYMGYGTLVFNAAPTTGLPLVPRYELEKVTMLYNSAADYRMFMLDPKHPGYILFNKPKGVIGEFRGWSGDGKWAAGTYWEESGNMDVYLTRLTTGESIRLCRDPAYTDPMHMSPDDKWSIILDNRQGERHMYFAAMRGIPPLVDQIVSSLTVDFHNGNRRFFQPFLLDRYGDRGDYHGQQLNDGPGTAGSPSDPNWNARADPTWSPDGTKVVYWQALVTAPACGGRNPLPCPESTEPGGRRTRLMMAHLTSRKPLPVNPVPRVSDIVPWGTPYRPGDKIPLSSEAFIPAGTYILRGKVSGQAQVEISRSENAISSVSVSYSNYSDDGGHIINGTEDAQRAPGGNIYGSNFIWHSNLRSSGLQNGTKVTGADGLRRGPNGGGSLITTIDGKIYTAPPPGT